MGSWNATCLTLWSESPDVLAEEVSGLFDQKWESLQAQADIPEPYRGAFESRSMGLDECSVWRRGEYVWIHHGAHGAGFEAYDELLHVVLAQVSAPIVARLNRFEDGQGACVVYQPRENLTEWTIEHRAEQHADSELDEGLFSSGYVLADRYTDWDSAYGSEHVALQLGTEYDFEIGIPRQNGAYLLGVSRERFADEERLSGSQ